MTTKLDLTQPYDASRIESGVYEKWESNRFFEPTDSGDPYSIAIPPPNVTGVLHLGHAFQVTIMDALARYHRMNGHATHWQMGTDHAGISTQMVVTEQLLAKGINPRDLGRDEFNARVWEWKSQSGGTICDQLRRLGASVSWESERFTMDDRYVEAVKDVFIALYAEDLIYKGTRLVNWDPKLETAISDLEVETQEIDGSLWHIRYALGDDAQTKSHEPYLIVATTRPETMFGDTAVAVHPDDSRYQHLIGGHVVLPIADRRLPIIADEHVDPEFGTGCLKITPGHDFDDYDIGLRHNLPVINIMTSTARLNENVPSDYQSLDRYDARSKLIEALKEKGLLTDEQPYKTQIPVGERSNEVIEPRVTEQWFVRVEPLAKRAIEIVENEDIVFQPKEWENVYYSWMRNIKDWGISRQLWWGHRIPVYYDSDGNTYAGKSESEVRKKHRLDTSVDLRQDPDVLDTWFSSALWTFVTLGWPEQTNNLERFHPTNVLVTGHDIIFFWVARMIMMTQKFTGEIPFEKVFITGLVRDAHGQKMSKTKGNGLDPVDIIEGISIDDLVAKRTTDLTQPRMAEKIRNQTRKDYPHGIPSYGTDSLRLTLAAIASPSRNCNFDLKRVEGNQRFCNKLWNATRYVLQCNSSYDGEVIDSKHVVDRWIQSRLQTLIEDCNRAIHTYRFDLYAAAIYQFAWHEYCDWYLELTKPLLNDADTSDEESQYTKNTLAHVLDSILRLTHPLMPFLTEVLWNELTADMIDRPASIMISPYPEARDQQRDVEAEQVVELLKQIITGVRTVRAVRGISPAKRVPIVIQGNEQSIDLISRHIRLISQLTTTETPTWLNEAEDGPLGSVHIEGDLKVILPFLDAHEIEIETNRITKELVRNDRDLERIQRKLENPNFVDKAPADIIEKDRAKHRELMTRSGSLHRQLTALKQSAEQV